MNEFFLESDYIELVKLIKLLDFAETGGMAKIMIESGEVSLNGLTEYRKKAKVRPGDVVEVNGEKIAIL